MSENPISIRMSTVAAWFSLVLAVSVQSGAATWWAGVQHTRLTSLERRIDELHMASPDYNRQIAEADRRIAVIDERIANILARLESLTSAFERVNDTRAPRSTP